MESMQIDLDFMINLAHTPCVHGARPADHQTRQHQLPAVRQRARSASSAASPVTDRRLGGERHA